METIVRKRGVSIALGAIVPDVGQSPPFSRDGGPVQGTERAGSRCRRSCRVARSGATGGSPRPSWRPQAHLPRVSQRHAGTADHAGKQGQPGSRADIEAVVGNRAVECLPAALVRACHVQ